MHVAREECFGSFPVELNKNKNQRMQTSHNNIRRWKKDSAKRKEKETRRTRQVKWSPIADKD